MVRIIFFCMAIVVLALGAMPIMQVFEGISGQRESLNAQFEVAEQAPADVREDIAPNIAPSAEMLNQIETAAGADEEASFEDTGELTGGFSGQTPEGL